MSDTATVPRRPPPPARRRDALHLAVSDACNNSCGFCLNGRVNGKIGGAAPHPPTWEETRALLERGYHDAHLREAWFTIAEPTLGPHLVDAVRYARELGYTTIGMNTNGRRLGKHHLIDRLLDAGLNRLMLSMHGHSAELHDRMVSRRGAYAQVLVGLERFTALRDRYDVTLQMLHVLCRVTAPHIEAMYRFFSQHARPERGDKLSYTGLKLLGSALFEGAFDEFGAPYGELVRAWLAAWARLGRPPEMLLSEVPGCVVIAQATPGDPIPPIDIPEHRFTRGDGPEQTPAPPRPHAERIQVAGVADAAVHYALDDNYCKHDRCATCQLDPLCPGVLVEYIRRFGFAEFPPVRALSAGQLPSRDASDALTDPRARSSLATWLLGLETRALRRLRLSPDAASLRPQRLRLSLRGPAGFFFDLQLTPRDETAPAFVRTRHLNLSYRASADHAFIAQLMRRLARRHPDTSWATVLTTWAALRRGSDILAPGPPP